MKMSDEEIYKKIEEIYKDEKGKGFITHLLRSFLPINRSTFMLLKDEKKKMRCSITNISLISKDEIIKFQIENHEQIFKNMSDRLLGKTTENVVVDNFKGKMLAVQCEKSERLLCLPAVQQLLNFASNELLKDNKHISFIIRDERSKETGVQVSSRKPVYTVNKPEQRPIIKATTKLGDLESLQNLKNKLESEGK
jgi:hypothetical protein